MITVIPLYENWRMNTGQPIARQKYETNDPDTARTLWHHENPFGIHGCILRMEDEHGERVGVVVSAT